METEIKDLSELVAQIMLTMLNCEPDFNEINMNDIYEFAEVPKKQRIHIMDVVVQDQAFSMLQDIEEM